MARLRGVVDWFGSKNQSYGYILRDDGPPVFVHYKSILPDNQENPKFKTLLPGQIVTFEVGPGYYVDGTQALNVKVEIERIEPTFGDVGGVG